MPIHLNCGSHLRRYCTISTQHMFKHTIFPQIHVLTAVTKKFLCIEDLSAKRGCIQFEGNHKNHLALSHAPAFQQHECARDYFTLTYSPMASLLNSSSSSFVMNQATNTLIAQVQVQFEPKYNLRVVRI